MRKKVIGLTLCAMLFAPCFSVEAQQTKKVPRIGYLTLRSTPLNQDEAFKQGLRELGWVEGQNFTIEWRFAAGRTERLAELAAPNWFA